MVDRAGPRDRWRGLVVLGDRLWYRPPGDGPGGSRRPARSRRPGLRFEPGDLVVVDTDGEQLLAWDGGERPSDGPARPAWSLHALPRGRGGRVAFRLTVTRPGEGPGAPRHLRLPAGALPPASELPALCRYLAATPAARPALADPRRLRTLLGQLAAGGWRRPEPPHEPLAGERLDLHVLVEDALDEVGWRRIEGRPVAGEPRPPADEVAATVRAALPGGLANRLSDSRLRNEVDRHLSVGAWPFDCLS